jgi:outer membrane receptor protein involved in Fe transport
VGLQVRRDWIDPVGLYRTSAGRRFATTREDVVGQTMTGLFGQTEIEWSRMLRTTVGLRADFYQFDVTSHLPENSGSGSAALASPKFGAVIGPWSGTEFYVNAGMGFHSNDARGAVIRVDPVSGEPVDRVTPLVRATGAELGLRSVALRGLQSTVAWWYLHIDSELLFVGDAGTTDAGRPSKRFGIEWTNYWRPRRWLTADADVSFSRARFDDAAPEGNYIPGALARVIAAGLSVEPPRGAFGSVRVRHFGPRPLIEDASVNSKPTTLWNAEGGYRLTSRARLVIEVYNIFNAEVSDIDYFYTSRLPGEPVGGIDDIHTHPALPRSYRVALQLTF